MNRRIINRGLWWGGVLFLGYGALQVVWSALISVFGTDVEGTVMSIVVEQVGKPGSQSVGYVVVEFIDPATKSLTQQRTSGSLMPWRSVSEGERLSLKQWKRMGVLKVKSFADFWFDPITFGLFGIVFLGLYKLSSRLFAGLPDSAFALWRAKYFPR